MARGPVPALAGSTGETIAFAFDIDGVLVRSKKALPGARETIKLLQTNGVPFIFLTNGGGLTEKAHIRRLGQRLDLPLEDETQFIQSHTPFYDLLPLYRDKTVLVLGGVGDQIRNLAREYGFQRVVTTSDLAKQSPSTHPFPEMTGAHHAEFGRETPEGFPDDVAAILVWSSPRDWCLDIQVISDLLDFGGRRPFPTEHPPRLYFCNPDVEWATAHPHPRLAQGAFREALAGLWAHHQLRRQRSQLREGAVGDYDGDDDLFADAPEATTMMDPLRRAATAPALEYTTCGKPTATTYAYAERALLAYHHGAAQGGGDDNKEKAEKRGGGTEKRGKTGTATKTIRTIYMIGDNPESDIAGARAFEASRASRARQSGVSSPEWKSVLVETGVYEAGTTPAHEPTLIARDVREAVMMALEREGMVLEGSE